MEIGTNVMLFFIGFHAIPKGNDNAVVKLRTIEMGRVISDGTASI